MSKKFNLFVGKAGHLTIMSEFLIRGWNVAMPEVDIGDDIFVVDDYKGNLFRIQVKTSMATGRRNSFSAQFTLRIDQLKESRATILYYAFISRQNNSWTKPLLIKQEDLLEHYEKYKGDLNNKVLNLYFSYSNNNKVMYGDENFSKYINNYSDFPIINH